MLEYSNTPITGMSYSPSQMLMSRMTRTQLPVHEDLIRPSIPQDVHDKMVEPKLIQKGYNDRSAKLAPLHLNEIVRIRQPGKPKTWNKAMVNKDCEYPNSYNVITEDGQSYRRNRRDLLK